MKVGTYKTTTGIQVLPCICVHPKEKEYKIGKTTIHPLQTHTSVWVGWYKYYFYIVF